MIEFIPQTLLSNTGVTALVGNRIKPAGTNQGDKFPYVTFQVISGTPERCREGIASEAVRVQVNVFDTTYMGKETLFQAVRSALDGASNESLSCELLDYSDLYSEPGSAHGKAIDFQLIIG